MPFINTTTTTTTTTNIEKDKDIQLIKLIVLAVIICGPFVCFFILVCCNKLHTCLNDCFYILSVQHEIARKKRLINKLLSNINIKNNKLSEKYIKEINKRNKNKIVKNNSIEPLKENNCAICMENIKLNNKNIYLDCGHYFHNQCLQNWVKSKLSNNQKAECPLCRELIIKKEGLNIYTENNSYNSNNLDYNTDTDSSDYDYNDDY